MAGGNGGSCGNGQHPRSIHGRFSFWGDGESAYEKKESEPAAEPEGDAPGWLSVMAAPEESSTPQSNARHAMPEHFPEVDLSKFPEESPTASTEESDDYAFSFNRV